MYKVKASARAMSQLVLRACKTVYHSITRHVPRLVGTSGRTKARLETVVCEPSVREHLGAPVSHAVNTNDALVRRCLDQLRPLPCAAGAPSWHNIGTIVALVRQGASDTLGSCL